MLKCVMIVIMKAQECRLNLCFQLSIPNALAGRDVVLQDNSTSASLQEMMEQVFDSEEERIFQRIAKKYYASTIEILESKLRRHSNFRASVIVDPRWLILAKKYNETLVNRLRAVVLTGRADLVYDLAVKMPLAKEKTAIAKLVKQVRANQEFFWQALGTKCRVACLDDLAYDDYLAGLLEKMGFEAYLVKGEGLLNHWESQNEIFLPASCDKMLTIVQNDDLWKDLMQRSRFELVDGAILSVDEFYKKLVTECLKGDAVSLVLNAENLQIDAEVQDGIAVFLRDLIEKWREDKANGFVSVVKICEADLPVAEIVKGEVYEDFAAEGVMRQIREIIEFNKTKPTAVEEAPPQVEPVKAVVPQPKAIPRSEPKVVVDDAETVNVSFVRPVKKPKLKPKPATEDDMVKVTIAKPRVRSLSEEAESGVPKMPRPVKAPGYALKAKMIDRVQQQPILAKPEDEPSKTAEGRLTLSFEDLWGTERKVVEEPAPSSKKKIPVIGSGNGTFQELKDAGDGEGVIEQFDYGSVEPQKVVRQIKFTAINDSDLGEIYSFERKK